MNGRGVGGHVVAATLSTLVLLVATSCGLVDHARGGSADIADVSDERAPSLERPVPDEAPGPNPQVEDQVPTTTPSSSGPPSSAAPPSDQNPASTDVPQADGAADITPEERLVIDQCDRIGAFQAAGYELYVAAAGHQSVRLEWIQRFIERLRDLIPAVSPEGDESLQYLIEEFESRAPTLVNVPPNVSVRRLQVLAEEVGPAVTQLLTDFTRICPPSMISGDTTMGERVDLSKREA